MRIIKLSKENLSLVAKEALLALRKGEVLACPTDTVYGLVADATNAKAIEKIFLIKRRDPHKPIPVFVKDMRMAKTLSHIKKEQEEFLRRVWPGKVTAVLKSKNRLPKELGTSEKIGLRIPKHHFIKLLLQKFCRPLTGTSANISGLPSALSGKEVISQFQRKKHQPDMVIDGGELPFSLPSTVVDLTGKKKKILRKGA